MNIKNILIFVFFTMLILSCNISENDKVTSKAIYMLSGGITSTEAVVTVKTDTVSEGKTVRIVLSESADFKAPFIFLKEILIWKTTLTRICYTKLPDYRHLQRLDLL